MLIYSKSRLTLKFEYPDLIEAKVQWLKYFNVYPHKKMLVKEFSDILEKYAKMEEERYKKMQKK